MVELEAIDLLQFVLNKAMANNMIQAPLISHACHDFPTIQYADDTIVAVLAYPIQIHHTQS